MSDAIFDASWLELREPADHRSRSDALVDILREEGVARGWRRVLDLGSGTGSNLRYLEPRLPWVEEWTALDHDPALLQRLTEPVSGRRLTRVQGDLAREGLARVGGSDVVTASALLDLVSAGWLDDLVSACRDAGAAVLFALSYDGGIRWEPPTPEDDRVREAVNLHQVRDKGLGAALGPAAAFAARDRFREAGFRTELAPSPWVLTGLADAELTLELLEGWVGAATEVRPDARSQLQAWGRRRRKEVGGGRFRVQVGHQDLLALPPA
ncbi:MAG: class I SAM-dependent methyltransferase [Gemmatimonadota bacterium]